MNSNKTVMASQNTREREGEKELQGHMNLRFPSQIVINVNKQVTMYPKENCSCI